MVFTSKNKGILCMFICALLWSTGGILIKVIPWHPMVISGLRSLIGLFVIWLALCKEKRYLPIINKNTMITGFLLASTLTLFVTANKMTTAANAVVLQSANPVMIMIISFFLFGKKISKKDLAAVVIIMFGIMLFFLDELSPGSLVGNILALLSAVTLGGMFIAATNAKTLAETLSGVFIGYFLAALIGIPFILLYPPEMSNIAVGALIFLGLFQLGIAYIFLTYSARSCSPLMISLIGMIEVILSPVWVAIFIHEMPGPLAVVGGIIVIITLIVWCVSNQMGKKVK